MPNPLYAGTIYEQMDWLGCDIPWCRNEATYWTPNKNLPFDIPVCEYHGTQESRPMLVEEKK